MLTGAPFVHDLLLIGGGHAHVQVLRQFGVKPEPGVRLTVIAREPHTPYSGMLPGYVAGQYTWDEIHIDLVKLSTYANARFVIDEAIGIDSRSKNVQFTSRPRYDTTPYLSTLEGSRVNGFKVIR